MDGMVFDKGLAQRVREAMSGLSDIEEKKMFSGITFKYRGNMCCGVVGEEIIVRESGGTRSVVSYFLLEYALKEKLI